MEGNVRHPLYLSSVVNLEPVVFQYRMSSLSVNWITGAGENIKSFYVRKMTLNMSGFVARGNVGPRLPDTTYTQRLALDKVLVECLTACSFKLMVIFPPGNDSVTFGGWVERLLPDLFEKKN